MCISALRAWRDSRRGRAGDAPSCAAARPPRLALWGYLASAAGLVVAGCALAPGTIGTPAEWIASPNFGERRPNLVVLHHTSDASTEEALATLTDPVREVSAHYLIGRQGRLIQLVDERLRAWHAGEANWGGMTDVNSLSIGIELDNTGNEPYSEAQLRALEALLRQVTDRWRIPTANVLGHGDVAPRRKADPGALFPWRRLSQAGFGLWCEPAEFVQGQVDDVMALQALGYDVSDVEAAVAAFKRHFLPHDVEIGLDAAARGMLNCLVTKKRLGR